MDVGVFYHPAAERNKARKQRIAQAKAICQQCPVIAECLDHALRVREPYGIWGGRSEDERAALPGVHSLRYPARIIGIGKYAQLIAPAGQPQVATNRARPAARRSPR